MAVFVARFSKKALESIPPDERTFFFSIAHLANEINALQKLLLFTLQNSNENDTEEKGNLSYKLLLLNLLAGKLSEGYKLFQKVFYGRGLSKEYVPSLEDEAQKNLKELQRYFGKENTVSKMRNNYAFHYSPDELDKTLPDIPEEELEIYISDDGISNSLYYFAEALAGHALLSSLDVEDNQAAFAQIVEEVPRVARWFGFASESLMVEFFKRHQDGIWDGKAEEAEFAELPEIGRIRLPWFTNLSNVEEIPSDNST